LAVPLTASLAGLRCAMGEVQTTLSAKQEELARHALGFSKGKKKSFRNHFLAENNSRDFVEWAEMEENGFARSKKHKMWGEDSTMFFLTLFGAKLAMKSGEKLSKEDFQDV